MTLTTLILPLPNEKMNQRKTKCLLVALFFLAML
jgi:hypothetical protein